MKPVVTDEDVFECRDKSKDAEINQKNWRILEFSDYQDSDAMKKSKICQSNFFYIFGAFGGDQNERYQACSYVEFRVSMSRLNIINSLNWNIGLSVFQC